MTKYKNAGPYKVCTQCGNTWLGYPTECKACRVAGRYNEPWNDGPVVQEPQKEVTKTPKKVTKKAAKK